MRIDGENHEPLSEVTLGLTRDEAEELRDALVQLLAEPELGKTHVHVSSADYQTEITVWLPAPGQVPHVPPPAAPPPPRSV